LSASTPGSEWRPAQSCSFPPGLVAALFIGSLQEELGWRGYALPRLLSRWGGVRASLVLGAAWACWHIPLYGLDGADPNGPRSRSS
jgi:membrane protease YdiL (CAAX protease family)